MGIPEYIYITLQFFNILTLLKWYKTGETEVELNFGALFVSQILLLLLFYWGGFFVTFGICQFAILFLYLVDFIESYIKTGREFTFKHKINLWYQSIMLPIIWFFLYSGGFFS